MDSQTSTAKTSAPTSALAELAVPTASTTNTTAVLPSCASALQGLPFDVDAMKSTFKLTSISSNVYEVSFKEMEDVIPMRIEDTTEGLVRHIASAIKISR